MTDLPLWIRLALSGISLAVLVLPSWWAAGRLLDDKAPPFWRALWALALALVGYLSAVNLVGRQLENSTGVALGWIVVCAAGSGYLLVVRRQEATLAPLLSTWREWAGPLCLALVAAVPQAVLAVSTNYYDEAASSAIHLTAPSQFAEGVFPPRHNALPDVVLKYHYGYTMLSGTVRWLTGVSANRSVDVVNTSLWLFAFLFVFWWLRDLGLPRVARAWGAVSVFLGGGLAWLYLTRIEAYSGVAKVPSAQELLHRWDPARTWWDNLLASGGVPAMHLRNADGSLSNLPWDIAAQFQQHAVALGLGLTIVALAAFLAWDRVRAGMRWPHLAVVVATFGILTLGHAAFGAMAAVTGGLWLLGSWLRHRTRDGFLRGVAFGVGVGGLALLHGGLFARGAQYGGNDVSTLRETFGYSAGGVPGFVHWHLAGFGIPMLIAIAAWVLHRRGRGTLSPESRAAFGLVTVMTAVSWAIPQVMFYSSDTIGVEQYTEISKFFFVTRLGLALLSGWGAWYLMRLVPWPALVPLLPAMAVIPLVFIYSASVDTAGKWLGPYFSPYYRNSIEQQMADSLRAMKRGPREVYFDASADERFHNYLHEFLYFGGSVFTLTPSRFERNGIGFRLSEEVVARRLVLNSRMARLQPGAAEECGCRWYYVRPQMDMTLAPVLVRSRFEKLVAESLLVRRVEGRPRALFEIVGGTANLDAGLERFWRPRIVTQSSRPGAVALTFHDLAGHQVVVSGARVALPDRFRGGSVQAYTGHFREDPAATVLVGHLADTEYRLGRSIADIVEQNRWEWSLLAPQAGGWQPESFTWFWDWDIPLVADLDDDGIDTRLAWRPRTGAWLEATSGSPIAGPRAPRDDLPLPFGGRFLAGSRGDLGLWLVRTGEVLLKAQEGGREVRFAWGGRERDVLVPGDYDGDGIDEIGIYQPHSRMWFWKKAPEGPLGQATFGTETAIPVPADYDGDGRIDLAYWEPGEGRIHVSFDYGRTVGRIIAVPAGMVPAWVNWT